MATGSAQTSAGLFTGQWSGTVIVDKPRILKSASGPEHRKLLNYAIARMSSAQVALSIYPTGQAVMTFDDGYRPDHRAWGGIWDLKSEVFTVHLRSPDGLSAKWASSLLVTRNPDGTFRLDSIPGMPKGLSVNFKLIRKNLPDPPRSRRG